MHSPTLIHRAALAACASLALSAQAQTAPEAAPAAQAAENQEASNVLSPVVVTGSRINAKGFTQPTPTTRIASLDAFRGFAIASMVLVNNPGDWGHLYAPLAHAKWNGWTFTDLVFPFFLFAAGMSLALSGRSRTCPIEAATR